jgi:hypothetical protein
MPHFQQLDNEPVAARAPQNQSGVRVVRAHHLLVRCSHWLNILTRQTGSTTT